MNTYLKNFVSEKFKNPGKALDLGAGDFFDVACMKQLGWKCEGIDIKAGVDLEKAYKSEKGLFDLVYSNYVLHKIKNKERFAETIYNNLKGCGWFFIHTFDRSDKNSASDLSQTYLRELLTEQGFRSIKVKLFSYYDNEEDHKHWHKILEAIGQK
jgi:SAM-dependent methyltransferase